MVTSGSTTSATRIPGDRGTSLGAQKVVVVNGSSEILELLETVLEAGHYDMVFVESGEHAYSQIKRVLPNLVILCMNIDDLESFQVLSMLKLDPETRAIPVLTYAGPFDHDEAADEGDDSEESDVTSFHAAKPALRMN